MALRILDATTRAAVAAATSRQGVAEAFIAAFAGGNVRKRYYSAADTHLCTTTIPPFTISGADSRSVIEAATTTAYTFITGGTQARMVYAVPDGADIFEIDCTIDGGAGSVDFPGGGNGGEIKELCSPTAGGVVVFTPNAGLPVSPEPALFQFIDTLDDGEVAEYSLPSLTVSVSGLGTPFGPSPEAAEGPFDWVNVLCYDDVTESIYAAGGRDKTVANATKMMVIDAAADLAYSIKNPYGVGTGHIYCAQCVIPEHRLHLFRGFHTGQVFLWNLDSKSYVGDLPAPPAYEPRVFMGENPAWVWFPGWGPYGSVVVVGRDVDNNGVIVHRYEAPAPSADFATGAWQTPVRVAGPVASTWSGDHPAGCYVPAAAAGIFGHSEVAAQRQLLIVPSGGASPYWTADNCPGGVSVIPSHGLITSHPTRAAAVIVSRADLKVYTYEFGGDGYVDRGTAAAIFGTVNQGITTIAAKDALVSLHGTEGPVANEIWAWKVGSTLG